MAFEEFVDKTRSNTKIPMVSILRHGRISFNSECYKQYLGNNRFVVLLYDKGLNKIGIRPTNECLSYVFNLKMGKNGKIASISATSFLNNYKIPYSISRSFTCLWNETEKIIEVQL
jgi:hypothetical protein